MYPGKFSLAEQRLLNGLNASKGDSDISALSAAWDFENTGTLHFHTLCLLNRYKILPQYKFSFLCFQILT